MAFRVGQDVVCIETVPPFPASGYHGHLPTKGNVYTIRSIGFDEVYEIELLDLEEIILPPCKCCGAECGFPSRLFRPLTQQNIDIVESLKAPPPADLDLDPLRPEEVAFQ